MRRLKRYFQMIVTAVICLAMNWIPGRRRERTAEVPAGGTGSPVSVKNRAVPETAAAAPGRKKAAGHRRGERYIRLKKMFFWLRGPGDMKKASYRPSG